MTTLSRVAGASAVVPLAAVVLAACGTDNAAGDRPQAVAGFYPLAYVAEQVGGSAIDVKNLTQSGVEPHDLELTARQVSDIATGDLVIYLAGFQPAVDEAVAQNATGEVLDVSTVVPLERTTTEDEHAEDDNGESETTGDPHIWLDPTRLATAATAVAGRLTKIDPDNTAAYRANAKDLVARLSALDREYEQALSTCERREFVTSHAAFGYLAARYDLEQIPVGGLSPEQEPSPSRLVEIHREIEERGITTIFFESLVSPELAETIARDAGAATAVLDPIEGVEDGSGNDYFTVMDANLHALTIALGCSPEDSHP